MTVLVSIRVPVTRENGTAGEGTVIGNDRAALMLPPSLEGTEAKGFRATVKRASARADELEA
ncbi:MAG: hypothetical protein Q8K82_24855 [Gemmatimonadaceae bacterium]|nr:hypothetical protein [Gemmatimonadaceae bacterium]